MRRLPDYTTLLQWLFALYAFSIPVSLDLLRIAAPLIMVVWLLEGNVKQKFIAIGKEPLFRAFGLLLLILLLSLLWTDPHNLKFGVKYITRYWYLLPMLAIFTSLQKQFRHTLLFAFLGGMAVAVAISFGVYTHIIPFQYYDAEGASPLMHHTLYSIFLALSIGLVSDMFFSTQKPLVRLLYAFIWVVFTINLFINIGRAGQLLFFPVLLIVLIRHYRFTLKTLFISLLLVIGIFYAAFTLNPQFKQKMVLTQKNLSHISYNTSLGARVGLNIVAKDIFLQHPFIGVGAGDYLSEKSKMIDTKYPDRKYVRFLVHYHDQYAEFAVIAGIFGLFAYLFMLFRVGCIHVEEKMFVTLKYLFLTVFVLSSFIDAMFHLNRPLSLFALMAGLLLAQQRIEKEASDISPATTAT